jgi:UDP-N-acetylmuramoylalanine--D-glutamate ligase
MMREPAFTPLPRPDPMPLAGKRVLVLGLGDTGLAVARWVERAGGKLRIADTRSAPPRRGEFSGELHTGAFTTALLEGVDLVCISPGVPLPDPFVQRAVERRIPVCGDIELFAWHVRASGPCRVIAVTGTNGKSTVTSLTGHLLRAAGTDCEVAGNIGPPVLDALMRRAVPPAAWVLELSSYQLETTWSLEPDVGAMLNLSEDHLDRYASLDEYAAAKARIFIGAGTQVLNRNDPRSRSLALGGRRQVSFGLDAPPAAEDWGLVRIDGAKWLAQGANAVLEASALLIHGWHNAANALAACALARAAGAPYEALVEGLRTFRGLPHRLERIAVRRGVEWYDDSKGTNVGATDAALRGLDKKAVLILGGEGKGQDFSLLRESVAQFARCVLLIGRDAPLIGEALAGLPVEKCSTLEDAVRRAAELSHPGDAVLLSPACASFDMFRDYRHRGEAFAAAVDRLAP